MVGLQDMINTVKLDIIFLKKKHYLIEIKWNRNTPTRIWTKFLEWSEF